MKLKKFLVFSVSVLALVSSALLLRVQAVMGADVVGKESSQVCWHGTASAEGYQLYYGQSDTHRKENTIFEGLDNRSKCVTISQLKPCTSYDWNLRRKTGTTWSWQWESDQRFTTGGVCPVAETGRVGTKVTTATGRQVTVTGNATATATWSVINGAESYTVYYGTAMGSYQHSITVPPKTTSQTINYLNPNATYYYRVAAMVNRKEVWQDEKVLRGGATRPVLGSRSSQTRREAATGGSRRPTSVAPKKVLGHQSQTQRTLAQTPTGACTNTGVATVTWATPVNATVTGYHILYGTNNTYQHALRNVDKGAWQSQIGALNSCARYQFVVQALTPGGESVWVRPTVSLSSKPAQ